MAQEQNNQAIIDIADLNDENGAVLILWSFVPTSVDWHQKWTTSPL